LESSLQVEEATKALEATSGMALEKNWQVLRVAFAKNILGPGSTSFASTHASNLAAATIEDATFSQQVCISISNQCYISLFRLILLLLRCMTLYAENFSYKLLIFGVRKNLKGITLYA